MYLYIYIYILPDFVGPSFFRVGERSLSATVYKYRFTYIHTKVPVHFYLFPCIQSRAGRDAYAT